MVKGSKSDKEATYEFRDIEIAPTGWTAGYDVDRAIINTN